MSVKSVNNEWSTGLCGCFNGKDVGLNCCVQNCCCQPCTWGDALRRAGVRDAGVYTLALVCGGNSPLDEFAGYLARRDIARRYKIEEPAGRALFYSFCCNPCARFQELNTILVNERLHYACAETRPDEPRIVPAAPVPMYMGGRKI